jgi:hypothetical protein
VLQKQQAKQFYWPGFKSMAFAITMVKMKAGPLWPLPLQSMRIAIIVPPFGKQLKDQASEILVSDWIVAVARQYPTTQWAVVGAASVSQPSDTPNLTHLLLEGRPAGLASRWWHRRRMQKLITGWQAQGIINLDPEVSIAAAIPQARVLHTDWTDKALPFFTGRRSKSRQQQLSESPQLVVAQPWQKEWLQDHYSIAPGGIVTTGCATTPHFQEASWAQRENWKQQFAAGQEYFLCAMPARADAHLLTLLKGFSAFKKRQRSSMRLVLMICEGNLDAAFRQKLDTYKYREDLVVLYPPDLSRLADACAGCYGLLASDDFCPGWWTTGALNASVPVVAVHQPSSIDLLGEAGVYVEAWKADLLAEAMMLLYKDETQRKQLIQEGRAMASQPDTTRWVGQWLSSIASK